MSLFTLVIYTGGELISRPTIFQILVTVFNNGCFIIVDFHFQPWVFRS